MVRVSRARIAVALLLAAVGGVTALLVTSVGAASSQRFHYTHRVVVVGHYVDHWTVSDPGDCSLVGDGTVTVNFRMKPAKVPTAARPVLRRRRCSSHGRLDSRVSGRRRPQ
jgi:hypothetical protein